MDALVLLGDSLFQRASSQNKDLTGQVIGSLGPRLSDAYMRKLDVVNRGFGGYNTRQILSTLSPLDTIGPSPAHMPDKARFVAILLGANDARLPNTPGGPQQHVPLAEFKENLGKIVRRVECACRPRHIILITTPPVDERMTVAADRNEGATLEGVVRRKAIVTAQYARAVRQLGHELGERGEKVKVLDLWGRVIELSTRKGNEGDLRNVSAPEALDGDYLDERGEPLEVHAKDKDAQPRGENTCPGSIHAPVNHGLQSYLIDGLHFSRKGYDLLYDELMALIESHWPEDLPDRLPLVAPAWDEPGRWTDGRLAN